MKINNLIKILTFSDILIVSGWGFVNPIFAVFVTQQVKGGNLELVGLATATFLVVRSVFLVPFGRLIDKKRGRLMILS